MLRIARLDTLGLLSRVLREYDQRNRTQKDIQYPILKRHSISDPDFKYVA